MKKELSQNQKFLVSLLIGMVLVGVLIFSAGFNMTGRASEVSSCTDSDGGEDYFIKGEVTLQTLPWSWGFERAGYTKTDQCDSKDADGNILIEYLCPSPASYSSASVFHKCEKGCSDGACLP